MPRLGIKDVEAAQCLVCILGETFLRAEVTATVNLMVGPDAESFAVEWPNPMNLMRFLRKIVRRADVTATVIVMGGPHLWFGEEPRPWLR